MDVQIVARLCHANHLDEDDEPDHIDVLLKVKLAEGTPSVTVLDVGVDGPQLLRRNNHLEATTVRPGGLPTGLNLQLVPALEEPLAIQEGDRLIVQLRLSTGITVISEVSVRAASGVAGR